MEALGTLDDFEFHRRAFLQVTVSVTLNSGVVDENVFATLALDEPVAFRGVKPLDGALFSIVTHVYFYSLFVMLSVRYLLPRAEEHKIRTLLRAAFGHNSRELKGDKREYIMPQLEGWRFLFYGKVDNRRRWPNIARFQSRAEEGRRLFADEAGLLDKDGMHLAWAMHPANQDLLDVRGTAGAGDEDCRTSRAWLTRDS